jgi:hypothetical protein
MDILGERWPMKSKGVVKKRADRFLAGTGGIISVFGKPSIFGDGAVMPVSLMAAERLRGVGGLIYELVPLLPTNAKRK